MNKFNELDSKTAMKLGEIIGDDEPYDPTGKSREQIDAELGYLSDDERGALSDLMRAQL